MRRSAQDALVFLPIATGVFFGVVTMLLVRLGADAAKAVVMGVLVGLVMCTANAVALSVMHRRPGVPRLPIHDSDA